MDHGEPRRESALSSLLLHLHPRTVPAESLLLTRTLGLGGAALVLFLLLAASGALLLGPYQPSPERAHASMVALMDEARFGAFVRNVHHWAASGLVWVAVLHLLRVFYQGGHLPPRGSSWRVGLALLVAVLASAFTGYLLPWDQLAYWAVTIGTGMLEYVPVLGRTLVQAARGGTEIGAGTLTRFFVLHVAILPASMTALLALHFWLIRKAGGVVLPRRAAGAPPPREELVPASPALTGRESAFGLLVTAIVMLTAAMVDAPLLAQANPGVSPNPARAPWYFQGVQELLVHVHPLLGAVVVPLLALVLLASLPSLGGGARASGRWFDSPRGARLALLAGVAGAALAVAVVLADEALQHRPLFPRLPALVRGGLLPMLAATALAAGVALLVRRQGASRLEVVQTVFTFALAAFAVWTITGVFFRGPGMGLAWVWATPIVGVTP